MGEFIISVPDDRLDELYESVAKLNKPEEAQEPPQTEPAWDLGWTERAVAAMGDSEKLRLWRIVDARARVPVSELSSDLGLPGAASPEQDFPDLAGFCKGGDAAAGRPAMPIVAGGSGDDGWYWMDPRTAQLFRHFIRISLSCSPA